METKNNSQIDKSNMRQVILDYPKQFGNILKSAKDFKIEGDFENIIICGIGGSALAASVFTTWLDYSKTKTAVPIYVHRDYGLPKQANKNSLVICISYSGNTEEPLSGFQEAIKKGIKTAAIASGGKAEEICGENNIPLIKIPSGIQPRSSTGYLFTALAKILSGLKLIEDPSKEIMETAEELRKTNQESDGKSIAEKLFNKIPVVYASNSLKHIARSWKIKFNENSKSPAFYNYFPELNHNEMVGFSQDRKENGNFHILILRDQNDHPRNLKRMDLFAELVKSKGVGLDSVDIKGEKPLFKIFSAIILGEWVSYYLALKYNVDPTPVEIIEEFKKKMA